MSPFKILILALNLVALTASGQEINQIKVGVNGLTCSACTRSVEMSLRQLDFIDSVAMSLENTEGMIYTKKILPVDFTRIAKAVTDAGFSVRFLHAHFSLNNNNIAIDPSGCFQMDGHNFQWINFRPSTVRATFEFIDSPFLPGNEYSKWKKKLKGPSCFQGQSVFHLVHVE